MTLFCEIYACEITKTLSRTSEPSGRRLRTVKYTIRWEKYSCSKQDTRRSCKSDHIYTQNE